MVGVYQRTLGADLLTKKAGERAFPVEMGRVVPWRMFVQIAEQLYPRANTARPPHGVGGDAAHSPLAAVLSVMDVRHRQRDDC